MSVSKTAAAPVKTNPITVPVSTKPKTATQIAVNNKVEQKTPANNQSPNVAQAVKTGTDTRIAKADLNAKVDAKISTKKAETLDLKAMSREQAKLEKTINPDPKTRKDINVDSYVNSVPSGTYTKTEVKQNLTVPKVTSPGLISIKELTTQQIAEKTNQIKAKTSQIGVNNQEIKKLNEQISKTSSDYKVESLQAKVDSIKARNSTLVTERERLYNQVRLSSSAKYNGQVFTATSDAPNVNKNANPIISFNGVNTNIARSGSEALEMSKLAGAPVLHVVNVNEMDKAAMMAKSQFKSVGGLANPEGVASEATRGMLINEQASTAGANVILNQLKTTKGDVKIMAYSQGNPIAANALRAVDGYYQAKVKSGDMKPEEKTAIMSRIKLLGIGSAAARRDFPESVKNNITVMNDKNDFVPNARNMNGSVNVGGLMNSEAKSAKDNAFREHLSYFQHYEKTDPGSQYNPAAGATIRGWLTNPNATVEVKGMFGGVFGGNKNERIGGYITDLTKPGTIERQKLSEFPAN
jgi:hypothetical protein